MDVKLTKEKWVELYVEVDDLLKSYEEWLQSTKLGKKKKTTRTVSLSGSEVATILAAYHLSGYKNFEYYYQRLEAGEGREYFPYLPSYKVFLGYTPRACGLMWIWAMLKTRQALRTGHYFVDSKKLEVCHIKREHQNKVFNGLAKKGKSTMGWFYGFKLHLVVNHLGEIVSFEITTANVADNNHTLLQKLMSGLKGVCVGDKGYLSTLFEWLYENGLHLLTWQKKNTRKRQPVEMENAVQLKKRGVIESINDILVTVCDIEHSRHRSPINALAHILGGLIAYQHLDIKPHVFIKGAQNYLQNAA